MIDHLLTLSTNLNPSVSSSSTSPSSSSSSTTTNTTNVKKLSLKQLIQVNESLLDSVLLFNDNHENENENENVTTSATASASTSASISISDIKHILLPGKKNHEDEDENKTVIDKILNRIISNENELEKCQSILLLDDDNGGSDGSDGSNGSNHEENILMVVQYLLRLSSTSTSSLERTLSNIVNITYPLLLSTPKYSSQLRDAILDASFSTTKNTTSSGNNNTFQNELSSCLDMIHQSISTILQTTIQDTRKMRRTETTTTTTTSTTTATATATTPEWIVIVIEFSSRLLSRILLDANDLSLEKKSIDCCLDTIHLVSLSILNSLCYYPLSSSSSSTTTTTTSSSTGGDSNSGGPLLMNGRTSTLLRIVTSLLLPCLLEADNNDRSGNNSDGDGDDNDNGTQFNTRMLALWDFIHDLIIDDDDTADIIDKTEDENTTTIMTKRKCRTWESTAPSIASGILCIIVQSISSLLLPLKEEQQQQQQARLIQHPIFWNFIKKALNNESTISVDSRGMKGGGAFSARGSSGSENNPYDDDDGMEDENVGQLVRRRSIHILRLLIEKEYDNVIETSNSNSSSNQSQKDQHQQLEELKSRITTWKKYILCFEALEMEEEAHLVDQVWDTVLELCAACCTSPNSNEESNSQHSGMTMPSMTWEMVGSLFARVLLSDSPTLRKLGLFKLLTGRAGIALNDDVKKSNNTKDDVNKKGKKKKKSKKKAVLDPSPISILSPSFVLQVLIPSYDSLSVSGFNFVNEGKTTNHDISLLIGPFITIYVQSLMKNPERLEQFMTKMLSANFIASIRTKTLAMTFKATADVWSPDVVKKSDANKFKLSSQTTTEAVQSLHQLFNAGGVVFDYQQSLLLSFSIILSNSVQQDAKKPDPFLVLSTLVLYVSIDEDRKQTEEELQTVEALQQWVGGAYGEQWVMTACASCASAFVSGQLVAFENEDGTSGDTLILSTTGEREIGASISKLSSLAHSFGINSASSLLWPAISKGLNKVSTDSNMPITTTTARQAARALILLESGCRERVLNGIGHGDLLIDKQGNMVPPPPTIELLLSRAVNFLLQQLNRVSICDIKLKNDGDINDLESSFAATSRSGSYLPNHFALFINQMITLKRAYPSSVIMTKVIYDLLTKSLEQCTSKEDGKEVKDVMRNISLVKSMCLLFGTLTFADEIMLNEIAKESDLAQCCSILLGVQFSIPNTSSSQHAIHPWQIKAMRSIFQHAKWGALSLLLPQAFAKQSINSSRFHEEVIDAAIDSVNATPAKGLLALFGCAMTAAKKSFDLSSNKSEKGYVKSYTKNMTKVINALFTIMDDTSHSSTRALMLQHTCYLIFNPERLTEEYNVFHICREEGMHPNDIDLPIRSAFRKLIRMAGTKKPHISKYTLSYISSAWLGNKVDTGLSAIPYREDIAKLLIHKEAKLDETMTHKEALVQDEEIQREGGFALLPIGTPETSVARGFLLTFISSLPNVEEDLSKDVKSKLCYYLILWLLDEVCLQNEKESTTMVGGGALYCQILRAWQSLCLLSRFVTSDIAELVVQRVYKAMSRPIHGQIRYFVEIFTIQCARQHPIIFGKALINEIKKIEISQHYVCSLMIVAGNLIVGNYANDFINSSSLKKGEFDVKQIIAAVVPWLGSTQSFCRGIAQLLLHKLVPLVFPSVSNDDTSAMEKEHNDWFFVRNTWLFLEKNADMQKLRKKQLRFFEAYETDSVCTPEGIFSFTIDEADESSPPYLIDALKRCLHDIGNENSSGLPEWKQMEQLLHDGHINDDGEDDIYESNEEEELVNFQRKILPVDTLNLTLENYKQQKRQNAAGRNRQSLIVCASLIDKVANLAGITRTAEIFAADRVLVPDSKVRKMDNFKSISVGAGEWVTIEECKENELLNWLKQCKKDGYKIVGVEQTSSSKCLSHVKFEGKSVLLLGKEKEGIPQQFLNVVDQCVEIPQLGVIRSLNVHVSAAICMWEYTKQMM